MDTALCRFMNRRHAMATERPSPESAPAAGVTRRLKKESAIEAAVFDRHFRRALISTSILSTFILY